MKRSWLYSVSVAAVVCGMLCHYFTSTAQAYVEAAMSLGAIVAQSTNIVLMRVEAVDKEKNLIIYRKVLDIKGKHPQDVIKHNIGRGGLRPNEWKPQMDWAEPGKTGRVLPQRRGQRDLHRQLVVSGLRRRRMVEPQPRRAVPAAQLSPGRRTSWPPSSPPCSPGRKSVAPCMVDGDKEDLHNRRAKIQRLKVSLKLQDYNPKRDFVGWGGEDFRRISGMPGFTHYSPLSRIDRAAGRVRHRLRRRRQARLCLVGGGKVLLAAKRRRFDERGRRCPASPAPAPPCGPTTTATASPTCSWPRPPGRSCSPTCGDKFRDDSHLLPKEAFYNLTAAAWIDYDGDGKPDLLLANGYHGLRLYRNILARPRPPSRSAPSSSANGTTSARSTTPGTRPSKPPGRSKASWASN